jgi:hypothetical protein
MTGLKTFPFYLLNNHNFTFLLVWCWNCMMLPPFPWNILNPNTFLFCRLNHVLRHTNKILKLFFRHTQICLTRFFCISGYCNSSKPNCELEVILVPSMCIVDWWKSPSGSSFSWNRFSVTEDTCKCFRRQVGQIKWSEHKCRSPLMCYTLLHQLVCQFSEKKKTHFMLFCSCVFSMFLDYFELIHPFYILS